MYAESSAILVYKYGYFKTGVVESYTVRRKNKAKRLQPLAWLGFLDLKKLDTLGFFVTLKF